MTSKADFGAFRKPGRVGDEFVNRDAPDVHIVPYLSGGLGRLLRRIQTNTVPQLDEYGYHTNSEGHFEPKDPCLVGLRYRVKRVIDSGGQTAVVVLAEDVFNGRKLVVVKLLHVRWYDVGAQESHVLRRLAAADPLNHAHTLRLLNTVTFDGHYCLVFEPLLPDPLTMIFQGLPTHTVLRSIKRVTLRLLTTLGFLHQQNMIHTDLKPDNILLKYENDLDSVHVVDFGNTIHCVHQEMSLYYKDFELQALIYRAPEVMFGIPFGPEIDMWSLGCILAELYLGRPLFMGTSKTETLEQVHGLLGPFPTSIFRRGKFFKELKHLTSDTEQSNGTMKLLAHLECTDPMFADLLAGLLRYNPAERLTSSEAACHPFLASHVPIRFLLPSSGSGNCYPSVWVSPQVYMNKPVIAADIKKRQLSTLELLRMGTEELPDTPENLPVKPSPRFMSPNFKTKIAEDEVKYVGEINDVEKDTDEIFVDHAVKAIEDASDGDDEVGAAHSPSDMAVIGNVIRETKQDTLSDNLKEKMASLLKAIKQEQELVEQDLDQHRLDAAKLFKSPRKGSKVLSSGIDKRDLKRKGRADQQKEQEEETQPVDNRGPEVVRPCAKISTHGYEGGNRCDENKSIKDQIKVKNDIMGKSEHKSETRKQYAYHDDVKNDKVKLSRSEDKHLIPSQSWTDASKKIDSDQSKNAADRMQNCNNRIPKCMKRNNYSSSNMECFQKDKNFAGNVKEMRQRNRIVSGYVQSCVATDTNSDQDFCREQFKNPSFYSSLQNTQTGNRASKHCTDSSGSSHSDLTGHCQNSVSSDTSKLYIDRPESVKSGQTRCGQNLTSSENTELCADRPESVKGGQTRHGQNSTSSENADLRYDRGSYNSVHTSSSGSKTKSMYNSQHRTSGPNRKDDNLNISSSESKANSCMELDVDNLNTSSSKTKRKSELDVSGDYHHVIEGNPNQEFEKGPGRHLENSGKATRTSRDFGTTSDMQKSDNVINEMTFLSDSDNGLYEDENTDLMYSNVRKPASNASKQKQDRRYTNVAEENIHISDNRKRHRTSVVNSDDESFSLLSPVVNSSGQKKRRVDRGEVGRTLVSGAFPRAASKKLDVYGRTEVGCDRRTQCRYVFDEGQVATGVDHMDQVDVEGNDDANDKGMDQVKFGQTFTVTGAKLNKQKQFKPKVHGAHDFSEVSSDTQKNDNVIDPAKFLSDNDNGLDEDETADLMYSNDRNSASNASKWKQSKRYPNVVEENVNKLAQNFKPICKAKKPNHGTEIAHTEGLENDGGKPQKFVKKRFTETRCPELVKPVPVRASDKFPERNNVRIDMSDNQMAMDGRNRTHDTVAANRHEDVDIDENVFHRRPTDLHVEKVSKQTAHGSDCFRRPNMFSTSGVSSRDNIPELSPIDGGSSQLQQLPSGFSDSPELFHKQIKPRTSRNIFRGVADDSPEEYVNDKGSTRKYVHNKQVEGKKWNHVRSEYPNEFGSCHFEQEIQGVRCQSKRTVAPDTVHRNRHEGIGQTKLNKNLDKMNRWREHRVTNRHEQMEREKLDNECGEVDRRQCSTSTDGEAFDRAKQGNKIQNMKMRAIDLQHGHEEVEVGTNNEAIDSKYKEQRRNQFNVQEIDKVDKSLQIKMKQANEMKRGSIFGKKYGIEETLNINKNDAELNKNKWIPGQQLHKMERNIKCAHKSDTVTRSEGNGNIVKHRETCTVQGDREIKHRETCTVQGDREIKHRETCTVQGDREIKHRETCTVQGDREIKHRETCTVQGDREIKHRETCTVQEDREIKHRETCTVQGDREIKHRETCTVQGDRDPYDFRDTPDTEGKKSGTNKLAERIEKKEVKRRKKARKTLEFYDDD